MPRGMRKEYVPKRDKTAVKQEIKKEVDKEVKQEIKSIKKKKKNQKKGKGKGIKQIIADTLPSLGQVIGATMGGPAGSMIGSSFGALGRKLLGPRGRGNVQISNGLLSGALVNGASRNVRVPVRHREFLGTLAYNNATSSQTQYQIVYNVNPSNPTMFTWLSQMAPLYERYRFETLLLEVKSMSNVTVSAQAVYPEIYVNNYYDITEPPATTKPGMLDRDNVSLFRSIDSFNHAFECKEADARRRSGDASGQIMPFYDVARPDNSSTTQQSAKTVYPGKIVFTIVLPANTSINSEMWVEYDVIFADPRIPISINNTVLTDYFHYSGNGALNAPYGTNSGEVSPDAGSTLLGTFNPSLRRYSFPNSLTSGFFWISIEYDQSGSTSAYAALGPQAYNACAVVPFFFNTSLGFYASNILYNPTQASIDFVVQITGPGATFIMQNFTGTMTSTPALTIVVNQISSVAAHAFLKRVQDQKKAQMLKVLDSLPPEFLEVISKKVLMVDSPLSLNQEEEKEDSWLT